MSRETRASPLSRPLLRVGLVGLALSLPFQGAAWALTQDEIAHLKGPDRSAILIDGAKKEGKVTLYTGMIVNQALTPLIKAFAEKHPYVDLQYWRGESRQINEKINTEKRANAGVADVVESGGVAVPFVKSGITQPFSSPELAAYPKEFYDSEGRFAATRVSYYGVAYNTKLVPAAEAPRVHADLLNPKWKDKIAWNGNAETGAPLFITNILMSMGDAEGEAYLKKFAGQKLIDYSGSARALVDRVGQGEFPLAVNIYAHHPLISAKDGAPLDTALIDPVPVYPQNIVFVKGAPHPYAGMLLIDFILSEEGQTVLGKADYLPAHPKVPPQEGIKRIVPRLSGHRENVISDLTYFDYRDKANDLQHKYFD